MGARCPTFHKQSSTAVDFQSRAVHRVCADCWLGVIPNCHHCAPTRVTLHFYFEHNFPQSRLPTPYPVTVAPDPLSHYRIGWCGEFGFRWDVTDALIIDDVDRDDAGRFRARDIHGLNDAFVNYVNFGGYPEAVFSETVRKNPRRYIKSDIIDKVLLRDLPSLYGIADVQELNSLFNTVAYNSAQEISVEDLSQSSGVSKPTIAKYLEYLEAAFLIKRLRRIDENAARFRKAMTFKVYLTNSTMRSALFAPLDADDAAMGHMVETAVFSQWLHNASYIESLHYARWKKGEVDLVSLDAAQRPRFAVEVKWSDRPPKDAKEIKALLEFARVNPLARRPLVTTRTISDIKTMDGIEVEFTPTSLHCYTVGRNTLERSR